TRSASKFEQSDRWSGGPKVPGSNPGSPTSTGAGQRPPPARAIQRCGSGPTSVPAPRRRTHRDAGVPLWRRIRSALRVPLVAVLPPRGRIAGRQWLAIGLRAAVGIGAIVLAFVTWGPDIEMDTPRSGWQLFREHGLKFTAETDDGSNPVLTGIVP